MLLEWLIKQSPDGSNLKKVSVLVLSTYSLDRYYAKVMYCAGAAS